MAFKRRLQEIPSPAPASITQKIMNFPRAVQAQLQEEPGMMKEVWGEGTKRHQAASNDLHLLGNIQAGFQDRG
jgi:hypothetical protein